MTKFMRGAADLVTYIYCLRRLDAYSIAPIGPFLRPKSSVYIIHFIGSEQGMRISPVVGTRGRRIPTPEFHALLERYFRIGR